MFQSKKRVSERLPLFTYSFFYTVDPISFFMTLNRSQSMEMHAPSAYPLAKVPRLFLIKMLISDLDSAAVAAVKIQASANRALAGKCCLCSCITVTSCSAGKHALECSGRNRCKLSTLINNAGNTVREGTAVDTVYYNRSDCHNSLMK